MKSCQKIIAMLLAICMMLSSLAVLAVATDDAVDENTLTLAYDELVNQGLDPDALNNRLMGDYNNDRVIGADDARIALRTAVSLEKHLSKEQLFVLDVDQDGQVTAADARSILRMSVGLDGIKVINVISDSEEEIDFTRDSDNDNVPDYIEEMFKTSSELDDSDNDGINDYLEIYVVGSDPAVHDSAEDYDEDGLSNYDEINTYKTSPVKPDSDADDLTDYEEINQYRTDPNNEDTDGDGVSDGKEIELGTDPLVSQSTFQIREVAEAEDSVLVSVDITLSGEQVDSLSIEKNENTALFPEEIPGYMGAAYDFNVDGDFNNATISFEFDEALMDDENIDPVIYYFNEEEQKLEPLDTTIVGHTASTVVEHFSTYILINRKIFDSSFAWIDTWSSEENYTDLELVFVIDDSGSMRNNDGANERLTVAKNLVDKLPTNSKIGVVNFESDIEILTPSLMTDRNAVKDYLSTSYFHSYGGTYMYEGIQSAITLFDSKSESTLRALVVLSDGDTFDTGLHSSVVDTANKNNIKIYTIGLGNSTSYFNSYLKPLSNSTEGQFYLAKDASQLSVIYEDIGDKIDLSIDTDHDGIPDYYEDNMVAFNGVKIELDKNNPDTDGDTLLDGDEIAIQKYGLLDGEVVKITESNADLFTKVTVIGIMKSNPNYKDSDFDGIDDSDGNGHIKDKAALDNNFKGTLRMSGSDASINYKIDYRDFFRLNNAYNPRIAKASLIFSSVMYQNGELKYSDSNGLANSNSCKTIVGYHMRDVVDFELKKGCTELGISPYKDDDLSQVVFGHKLIEYGEKTKEVIAVFIRGTDGSVEEWSSNFDMGNREKFSSTADWKDINNHKGFDVASNRILGALEKYINKYVSNADTAIWVTGHSRGAAIANIVGAKLVDKGNTVFCYTFATPNTTINDNANATKYNCIFNYINQDDFVPAVPMSTWDFTRYGKSAVLDINGTMEKEWERLTGIKDYNPISKKHLDNLVNKLSKCSTNKWDTIHTYTCSCHGNKTNDKIIEKGVNIDTYEGIIAHTRPNQYCIAEKYKRFYGMEQYKLCQTTAYFMQVLAEIMATQYSDVVDPYHFLFINIDSGTMEKITEMVAIYSLADQYESARNEVIKAAACGIEHAHYTETYYIMLPYISGSLFSNSNGSGGGGGASW